MVSENNSKGSKAIPKYWELFQPVYDVINNLGGSATNAEIIEGVIHKLDISDDLADIPHNEKTSQTELAYRISWAKSYLKNYEMITNSERGVWTINPEFPKIETINKDDVINKYRKKRKKYGMKKADIPTDRELWNDYAEFPEEIKPWRERLSEVIQNMDPYGFERLAQRVLRECGFTQVTVTKKSGDGGIDGTGKLRINGIFSFNVAFQCKRYKGSVGASDIRDFRGSLTTDVEKGVMITTGTFSTAAKEEAATQGKKQIDLIDGEDFISKLAEYGIGVRPITTYEIDVEFFNNI